MNDTRFRWGILGAANIARKNWQAIRDSGNGVVAAVASRDKARAQEFIDRCQSTVAQSPTPEAVEGYDALLARPDIEGVYIPLPTGLRREWVLKAAAAGKHAVCEKPCGTTLEQVLEMTEACTRAGVQFSDGVMFMHGHRLAAIRAALDAPGVVGRIKRLASGFSFHGGPEFEQGNIRMHSLLEPHGCLGDLGWYSIRFALWAMNWETPVRVTGRILAEAASPGSPDPVPTEFSGDMIFASGASMNYYCSFITQDQQWVHVSGTEGSLRIDDFVLPFYGDEATFETIRPVFRVEGCAFNMEPHRQTHRVSEYSNNHPTSQEAGLYRNFARQARSGTLNAAWSDMAVQTQRVMEACLASARDGGREKEIRA